MIGMRAWGPMVVALALLGVGCGGDDESMVWDDDDAGGTEADGGPGDGPGDDDDDDDDAPGDDDDDDDDDDPGDDDDDDSPGDDDDDSSGDDDDDDDDDDDVPGPDTVWECFDGAFVNDAEHLSRYEGMAPTVGAHCRGTDHQDIVDVERVVFLGDSITVGSPPTAPIDFYRSRLAVRLAEEFALDFAGAQDGFMGYNPVSGSALVMHAGDFSSCARWGGQNEDLLQAAQQREECFPQTTRGLETLVVITSGGNDLSSIANMAIDGASEEVLWEQAATMVEDLRGGLEWLADPARFPAGVHVVFGNVYEFTDGVGDIEQCAASTFAGFDGPLPDPDMLADLAAWINEEYMAIAIDLGYDMAFMAEEFCGHGQNAADPSAPCYRGPGTEVWFDFTCIHPTPGGHGIVADAFEAIITN